MTTQAVAFLSGGRMTDHVKDQLCQRIEVLEKEKLELNEQLDIAQRERDALAAPAVQGEQVAWSGWGCQYPGRMPRLYGDRRIAELNCDTENGDQVLHFTASPQPEPSIGVPGGGFYCSAEICHGCGHVYMERPSSCDCGNDEAKDGFESAVVFIAAALYADPQTAEQQPEPDVAALVEALEQVIKAAPSGGPLWYGSKQIVEARAALAAHRKGGE